MIFDPEFIVQLDVASNSIQTRFASTSNEVVVGFGTREGPDSVIFKLSDEEIVPTLEAVIFMAGITRVGSCEFEGIGRMIGIFIIMSRNR